MCEFRNCRVPAEPGEKLCILHLPSPKCIARFKEILYRQIDETGDPGTRNIRFDFDGYCFPVRIETSDSPQRASLTSVFLPEVMEMGAYFGYATMEAGADLRGATIEGNVSFQEAKILDPRTFLSDITIQGRANFSSATIEGNIHVNNAKIAGDVYFSHATITQSVFFDGTTIEGNAFFDNARIEGAAIFSDAQIWGNMSVYDTLIGGDARFDNVTIGGDAEFNHSIIKGDAVFSDAKFRGDARFDNVTIGGDAGFSRAMIDGGARFIGATIEGIAYFSHSKTGNDVRFDDARIGGEAHFYDTQIGGEACFSNATIVGRNRFDRCRVGSVSLGRNKPRIRGWGLARERCGIALHDDYTASLFWRFAQSTMNRTGDREGADAAFYFGRVWHWRALRKVHAGLGSPLRGLRTALLRAVYWALWALDCLLLRWTTAYGASIARLFATWFAVVGGFGITFAMVPKLMNRAGAQIDELRTWIVALHYSVTTFTTLGLGHIGPGPSQLGMVLASIEALLGALLIALAVLVIGRRFMR